MHVNMYVCIYVWRQRLKTYDRDVGNLQRDIKQLSEKILTSKKKAASNTYTEIQVDSYIHTYIHTYIHAYTISYIPTYIHTLS
jgi:hypothetical protein